MMDRHVHGEVQYCNKCKSKVLASSYETTISIFINERPVYR